MYGCGPAGNGVHATGSFVASDSGLRVYCVGYNEPQFGSCHARAVTRSVVQHEMDESDFRNVHKLPNLCRIRMHIQKVQLYFDFVSGEDRGLSASRAAR